MKNNRKETIYFLLVARVLLLFILLIIIPTSIKSENIFQIQKGINIASWLSTPKYSGELRKGFIQESDIQLIADMGLDHVRLCVDEATLWNTDGEIIRPYAFDLVHDAIQWCSANGLKVIFDLHITRNHRFTNSRNLLFDDANEPAKFIKLWEDISDELSQYPNSLVAYELLNEPVSKDPADWNRVSALAINAIRAKEPNRTIIVGVCTTDGVVRYNDLILPADNSNLMMTFHFYGPFLLTAYGLQSTTNGRSDIPIYYPGRLIPEEYIHLLPVNWQETGRRTYDRERLKNAMRLGFDRANQLGVPVFVGEFGTLRYLPNPARINWYRDVVSICEEFSSPYTSWDYKGAGYSIVSEEKTILYPDIATILKGALPPVSHNLSYYVKKDGNNNLDGRSWENALASIAAAVEKAGNNDTIKVSEGVFKEGEKIYINEKHIILQGGYYTGTLLQDFSLSKKTILDGNNAHQLIRVTGASGSKLTLNNFILQNGNPQADQRNGGAVESYSPVFISNCVFKNNTAKVTTFNDGGAIHLDFYGTGRIFNCVFYNNESGRHGGALNSIKGNLYVTNCTFSNNKSATTGGAVRKAIGIGELFIQNSILWANTSGTALELQNLGTVKLSNNILKDGLIGIGGDGTTTLLNNDASKDAKNSDPLFVSSVEPFDFRLSTGSTATNSGNNVFVQELTKIDIIGVNRIMGSTVDLGAYESDIIASIENSPTVSFKVYKGLGNNLHIMIDDQWKNSLLTIVDLGGRQMHRNKIKQNSFILSLPNLTTGIYILTLDNGDNRVNCKILL